MEPIGARESLGPSVGLSVLSNNMVARDLYDSLGYQVTAQQLKKVLTPGPGTDLGSEEITPGE